MSEKLSVEYQGEKSVSPEISQGSAIACEVIRTAVEDIQASSKKSEEKEAEDAFLYLQSKQFKKHCEMASLNPDYIVGRKLAYKEGYVATALRMNKSRHLAGSSSKEFKRTIRNILNDHRKLESIIHPNKT